MKRGLRIAPKFSPLEGSLYALRNGRSKLTPSAVDEPTLEAGPPVRSPAPAPLDSGDGRSPSAPEEARPERPDSAPDVVPPYRDALNEYRAMVDAFQGDTGQPYEGVRDFKAYAKESSNWMAWRYAELWQQYMDAGRPEEAAAAMEAAARRFPDDRLIRDLGSRSR